MICRNSHGLAKIPVAVFSAVLLAFTAIPAFASGTFQKTGSMNVARVDHTATLLSNGEVLVAGGVNSGASAELYNPSTDTWSFTGSMTTARFNHQAVLLQNGEVLVAGGGSGILLASAELYDPSTGVWIATGSMNTARSNFSLTLLTNGQVLAVQGTSAELYNPATGTWTVTGSPTSPVAGPNAALLLDGQVLAIERTNSTPSQLYDPSSGTWSATGNTDVFVPNPFVFRLPSGDVFVTGSYASGAASYANVALYDPSTGQFTLENGPCNCRAYSGALLQTGKVLVAGGFITVHHLPYNLTQSITSAELWDPATQTWTSTGNLNTSRGLGSMTVLANAVLVAGGSDYYVNCYATAELYNPATGQWALTGSMSQPRCLHNATLLSNGEVLVSGGVNSLYDYSRPTVSGAEIYNPNTGTWTPTGSLNTSRASAATSLLQNGQVLSAGGYNNTGNNNPNTYLTSAEIYDPSTGQWSSTGSLPGPVGLPATPALLLTNGDVLIANDAQLYAPNTGTWSATGPIPTNTSGPPTKAALLGNGNALGTGGQCKSTKYYSCHAVPTTVAYLYSLSGDTWSQTGSMNYPRFNHTMTLLLNGQVLVAGGLYNAPDNYQALSTAELYTP